MSVESEANYPFNPEEEPQATRAIMLYAGRVSTGLNYEAARKTTVDFYHKEFGFDLTFADGVIDAFIQNDRFPSSNDYIIDRDAANDKLRVFLYSEIIPFYEQTATDDFLNSNCPRDIGETGRWVSWAVAGAVNCTHSRHSIESCRPAMTDQTNVCQFGLCPLKTVVCDIQERVTRYDLDDGLLGLAGEFVNAARSNYFEDEKININRRIYYAGINGILPNEALGNLSFGLDVAYDSMYRRLASLSLDDTDKLN